MDHGTCRFFINNDFYTVKEGDLIVIPKQLFHYTKYSSPCVRTAIFFRDEDLLPIDNIIHFSHTYQDLRIYHLNDSSQTNVKAILENMLTEMRFDDEVTVTALQVQLQGLFLYIHRYCNPAEHFENIHTNDEEIVNAARFISNHYAEHITTKDIAAITGFTTNYLSTKFREKTGIGLHEYLVFTRLHHAERLLLSTHLSITEIALECGFTDSNYFKDAFKKMYGLSPRKYRSRK